MIVNCTVADELYLRNAGNSFEIGMKDRLLRTASLVVSMAITLGLRIKCLLHAWIRINILVKIAIKPL